jgi:hypothetical protein
MKHLFLLLVFSNDCRSLPYKASEEQVVSFIKANFSDALSLAFHCFQFPFSSNYFPQELHQILFSAMESILLGAYKLLSFGTCLE